ncbi:MAG: InlB B-repeat-containing protein [Dehalococcoidia bacterium]|nr:InlB B-repeat-containing protein [Dehalococcoidia bacterium]MDH4291541.1 InlB B-repeat-containing protein [Dehalococcoidia bacterium]
MIKGSSKKLRVAAFGFLVLLLALLPASPVVAQGLGQAFYGTVNIDGGDAAVGTVISAQVAGTEYGSCIVTSAGSYALIVQGEIDEGATIYFYVAGQESNQTFPFHDGWTTELNLTVTGPAVPRYALTMAKDPVVGGNATDETGGSPYAAGATVRIKAVANPGYGFVNWTANSTVTFADATAPETTFTMPARAVTVTAHFGVTYELDMAADPVAGGGAIDVAAKGAYAAGATVSIRAEPATGYGFVNWTADAPVTFQDATAEETTFTMLAQALTVTAHFGVAYNLTMAVDPVGGGDAIDVADKGAYAAGATVGIRAVANPGYAFGNWTADATVTFGSVTAAQTTFTMPAQALTVTAHFEEALPPPEIPTVATLAATSISSYSASVHMSYTRGNFGSVDVRFACKRPTDPAWFYSTWVSRTADGNYTEVLTGLVSQTQYQFKAQLKYSDTVIEGDISQFTTGTGSGTNLNDLLAYFGCFIATAAYGSPTAEQINVLRDFRDVVLLKSTLGCRFVALYYRLSPPVADFIAGNEALRTLVRELLVDPIVWLVEATRDVWRN